MAASVMRQRGNKMQYRKYELIMRKVKVNESKHDYKVINSKEAIEFGRKVLRLQQYPEEHFYAVMLDTQCNIIGYSEISKGGLTGTAASPRDIFKVALVQNANGIILYHNHPSGNTTPSAEDIVVTQNNIEAGKLLGINVLDHIIIGNKGGCSFLADGLMEKE